MKTIFLILTLPLIVQFCSGQSKKINIPITQNGDTTGWYKPRQKIMKRIGLENLINSKDLFYFRISDDRQIIAIWTNNFKAFHGTLTNYISGSNFIHSKTKDGKLFKKMEGIDTSKAEKIYEFLVKDSILSIPTQENIKGWGSGLDGIMYFIEESTPNLYSFKEYWTPFVYKDHVPDARKIYDLILELENILKLNDSFNKFTESLPYGTYNSGMIMIIKNRKTKKNRQLTDIP